MKDLIKKINEYKETNSMTTEQISSYLKISTDDLKAIESGQLEITKEETERILALIEKKNKSTGKKIVRILDLCFRFISAIMSFVVLLLCINGYENTNALVLLMAIGLVCSSITTLPKIEK